MIASSRDLTWHVSRNGTVSRSGRYGANALLMETELPPQAIESRVDKLEEHVANLQELPHRMDALSVQISQLREDLGAQISRLREDAAVQSSATERTLREEIIAGDERIVAQVRVLHEDVISRLALIQEGQPRPRKRRN